MAHFGALVARATASPASAAVDHFARCVDRLLAPRRGSALCAGACLAIEAAHRNGRGRGGGRDLWHAHWLGAYGRPVAGGGGDESAGVSAAARRAGIGLPRIFHRGDASDIPPVTPHDPLCADNVDGVTAHPGQAQHDRSRGDLPSPCGPRDKNDALVSAADGHAVCRVSRIDPLWAVPVVGGGAVTGMDDRLSPGSVSQLARSDEVAFRVRFDGEPPPRQDWYWRGMVLNEFDQGAWTSTDWRDIPPTERRVESISSGTPPLRYEVLHPATHQRWLFTLPHAQSADARLIETASQYLMSRRPVDATSRFEITTDPSAIRQPALSPWWRAHELRVA